MKHTDIRIDTPCGADWSQMTATDARARLCAQCNKVVHDLTAMTEREVRGVVGDGPVCVRYLYDVHGRVLFGGAPAGAKIVPASALLSRAARSRWLAAAALAATAIVFEACGGNDGSTSSSRSSSGSSDDADAATPNDPAPPRVIQMPSVGDASADADAGVDPDAGTDPDAAP
jgi:hypothetical protein